MELNKIISTIKEAKRIAILPHVSADGDALGSSIALSKALKKLDIFSVVFLEEEIANHYDFLPDSKKTQVYDGQNEEFDVVVALDTGDLDRLGKRVEIFNSCKIRINIDHHRTNTKFGSFNYIDIHASATGEIIYQLIKMMGVSLDNDIANCLYIAIVTDTGGFRHSNTTGITHQIVADLINNGVNVSETSKLLFGTNTISKVRMTAAAIDSLELIDNDSIAVFSITKSMIDQANSKDEECDGLINIATTIKNVRIAVMLREKAEGVIKASLRANDDTDVSYIAGLFQGGGHKKAAGCTIKSDINEAKSLIIDKIREVM